MSQQYQRFKSTFLNQHPQYNQINQHPQHNHLNQYPQYNHLNQLSNNQHHQYNNRLTSYGVSVSMNRDKSNDNLHIQEQSHYPFQQIQQATFTQSIEQPYKYQPNQQQYKHQHNQQQYKHQHNQQHYKQFNQKLNKEKLNNKINLGLNQHNYEQQQYQSQAPQQNVYKLNDMNKTNKVNKTNTYQVNDQHSNAELQKINQQLSNLRHNNINSNHTIYHNQSTKSIQSQQPSQQRYLTQNYFINNENAGQLNNSINSHNSHYKTNSSSNTTLRPQQQTNSLKQSQQQIQSLSIKNNNNSGRKQSTLTPPKQLPIIYSTSPRISQQHQLQQINLIKSPQRSITPNIQSSFYEQKSIVSQQQPIPQSAINQQSMIINSQHTLSPNNSRLVISQQQQHIFQPQNQPILMNNIKKQNSRVIIGLQQIPPQPYPSAMIQSSLQNQLISIKQYQRIKSQCLSYQHQLQSYERELQSQSIQMNRLKQENIILVERIKSFQSGQKQSYDRFKNVYQTLLKKYQQSLYKQTGLLIDRCRLQMRHHDRI